MTTPELEAVARAIFCATHASTFDVWAALHPRQREPSIRAARAALLAIREPTEGMILRAHNAVDEGPDGHPLEMGAAAAYYVDTREAAKDMIRVSHSAMIDHILGETT